MLSAKMRRGGVSFFPLVPRKKESDKTAYGHVLAVAGSDVYPGAALLTARAALLAGSGLVTLAVPGLIRAAVLKKFPPEVMPLFYKNAPTPLLLKTIRQRRINALALGPGLGREAGTSRWVRGLVRAAGVPIVLDADGLNAFKGRSQELKKRRGPLVLTPHEREFQRLFGASVPASLSKKAALAKKLSKSCDSVIVLKGHKTLVVYRDRTFTNGTGNPGMAKGGSGDVLTGVIAAFIAQGMHPFQASVWGVYFHGKAGDMGVKQTSEMSLTATDLIEFLPKSFLKK